MSIVGYLDSEVRVLLVIRIVLVDHSEEEHIVSLIFVVHLEVYMNRIHRVMLSDLFTDLKTGVLAILHLDYNPVALLG
jgi:hypothetical protein